MPDVTVGVMRWSGDQEAKRGQRATSELQCHWVQIGDTLITAEDDCLIGVEYSTKGGDFARVTLSFAPSSFKTVDHRKRK